MAAPVARSRRPWPAPSVGRPFRSGHALRAFRMSLPAGPTACLGDKSAPVRDRRRRPQYQFGRSFLGTLPPGRCGLASLRTRPPAVGTATAAPCPTRHDPPAPLVPADNALTGHLLVSTASPAPAACPNPWPPALERLPSARWTSCDLCRARCAAVLLLDGSAARSAHRPTAQAWPLSHPAAR